MIRKASELLGKFIEAETKRLDGFKMPHMPTLGSAYEEITKQGIYQDFAIPKDLDLRVVSGFISIGGEMLAEQIDCMLVHGEGEQFGLTQQYKYDVGQVLCIFEVKKTLRKSDYIDALQHLAKIRKKFSEDFEVLLRAGYEPDITAPRRRFSQLTGKVAPTKYRDLHSLPKREAILFYTLVQESLAPATIIHGYEGYRTEEGLRTVFLDIVEDAWKKGGGGFGVPSFPTLVTANNFCLVKGNGMPFLGGNNHKWVAIYSARHNSAKMILELIWSKISNYFGIEMPWDDGLHMDSLHPLLIATAVEAGGAAGWKYSTVEPKERKLKREDDHKWAPSILGNAEMSAINIMAMKGGCLLLDAEMNEYLLGEHGVTVDLVSENLVLTGEFMRDGEFLKPIHPKTYIITNEDETGYVASEVSRFDTWCKENEIGPYYLCIHMIDE
ncbi:DUF6602 domain-containing protein [Pseudomonas fluorescens]